MGRRRLSEIAADKDRLAREKIQSELNVYEEGEGELFAVKVTKVVNGFIVRHEKGDLVFNHDTYGAMLDFIIHRRLKVMQPGEEIELELKQIFTKKLPPQADGERDR